MCAIRKRFVIGKSKETSNPSKVAPMTQIIPQTRYVIAFYFFILEKVDSIGDRFGYFFYSLSAERYLSMIVYFMGPFFCEIERQMDVTGVWRKCDRSRQRPWEGILKLNVYWENLIYTDLVFSCNLFAKVNSHCNLYKIKGTVFVSSPLNSNIVLQLATSNWI